MKAAYERLDATITKLPFKLAPLQLQDVREAAKYPTVSWFLEVGVGKTVCSILTAIAWGNKRNIVITPPIILDSWAAFLKQIGETDVEIYRGVKRTKSMLQHKWVLVSHAIFRDSFQDISESVHKDDTTIIVDEAQALKNPASKLFKYIKALHFHVKLQLLSGTPISKPEDSFAYCYLVGNSYRSFGHWQNLHVAVRDFFGRITEYRDLDEVAARLKHNSFKRSKEEVFGVSEGSNPIYSIMPYKLADAHSKLYKKLVEEQLLLLDNGEKIDATSATRLFHCCQQIVLNYSKFSGVATHRSAGYDILDEVIEETDCMNQTKSKLIVWTYYQASSATVVQYLRDKFGEKAIAAAYGAVNSNKGVKSIMEDPECRILVGQPTSCGVGLNLQHNCSEMLFLEFSTTPAHFKQSVGRIARTGQKVKPTIRVAQAIGTIQEHMLTRLMSNGDLVDRVEGNTASIRQALLGGSV